MSKRPSIPIKVRRAILVEAGHRCAVCGTPCPLEHAHIIPWRRKPSHCQEDLICLCANCHARADSEHWGEEALREYKSRPWFTRGNNQPKIPRDTDPPVRVTMQINMEMERFDSFTENMYRHALAGLLHISPDQIKVVSKKRGSIRITLELPERGAKRLFQYYKLNSRELQKHLRLFPVEAIEEEDILSRESVAEVKQSVVVGLSGARRFPTTLYRRFLPRAHDFRKELMGLTERDYRHLEDLARRVSKTYGRLNVGLDYQDLLLEAISRTLEGSHEWPQDLPLDKYLFTTMKYLAASSLRASAKRRPAAEESEDDLAKVISALPDPEHLAIIKEEVNQLRKLLANDAVANRILDGWSIGMTRAEICTELGISERSYDAARKRIWRAARQRSSQ